MKRMHSGFTLVEVLVVMVILAMLASVVIPNVIDNVDTAREKKVVADFAGIKTALNNYRIDNYRYPSTEQGLQALVEQPSTGPEAKNWKAQGYLSELPIDPWQQPYYYQSPGEHGPYDLYTLGADGLEGGEGLDTDIGNWRTETD